MRQVKRQAPSGPPGGVRPNEKGAHGEIDTSRPGGVKTLKSKYESRNVPPLSPTLFRRTSPNSKTDSFNFEVERDSKVQFAGNVQHIPSPQSLSPPPEQGSSKSPLELGTAVSVPPTPPPPPPPPQQPQRSSAILVVTPDDTDNSHGRHKPIRVGSIQWPPPAKKDDKKREPEVGKLYIEEKKVGSGPRRQRSREDAHAHMMSVIRSRNEENEEENKPEVSIVTPHSVQCPSIYAHCLLWFTQVKQHIRSEQSTEGNPF